MPSALILLCVYLGQGQGIGTGFGFIGSTPLAVWRPQGWGRKAHPPRGIALLLCRTSPMGQPFDRLVFPAKGLHASRSMAQRGAHEDHLPVSGLVGDLFSSLVADRGSLFCKRGNQRQGLLALPLRTKLGIQREKATPAQSRPAPAARRVFIEIRIDPRQNSAPMDPSRPRSRPFLGSISSADALFMATNPKNRPQNRAKSRKKAPFFLVIQSLFRSIGREGRFFGSNFLVFGFNFPVIGT